MPPSRTEARANGVAAVGHKPRVLVAAESRLLRAALSRMLTKSEDGKPLKDDASEVYSSPGAGP
jgi:hypothetical protein